MLKEKLVKRSYDVKIIFLLGCLIGIISFISIYGVKVLDVKYDDWLMNAGGDLVQHYTGWKIFRASQWNFPIGLMDGLLYPDKVSVIYMDSIPIFAIIFKIFSPILPKTFQYFGIWGIISFMLQGGISAVIIRKFTKNAMVCMMSSLLFLFLPILIGRMFAHTALAGQWIILLSIYAFIQLRNTSLKKNVIIWTAIACLSSTVHIYFVPMIMVMLFCYILRDYLKNRSIFRALITFVCPILATLFVMYLLGAFYGKSEFGGDGLGYYSANINALLNPQGFSRYLFTLPLATNGQYEGTAYLGLGVILGLIVTIYLKIRDLSKNRFKFNRFIIINNVTEFSLCIAIIIFFVLALSPTITLNSKTLFTIHYPQIIIKLLNIFRSSGRFMWPICYLLIIYIIKTLINNSTTRQIVIFILLCSIAQISDLEYIIQSKENTFMPKVDYVSDIKSNTWREISNKNYKHIVFMSGNFTNLKLLWDLTDYAVKHDMTVNDGYVARKDENYINSMREKYKEELEKGEAREDTIYIFENNLFLLNPYLKNSLNYYNVNGAIIGIKDKIKASKEEMDLNEINILPRSNEYLTNGEDDKDVRKLHEGGSSYGPYIGVGKGTYMVTITGNSLSKINYNICYNMGNNVVNTKELERSDEKVVFSFTLEDYVSNLECRTFNLGKDDVLLNKIIISQ